MRERAKEKTNTLLHSYKMNVTLTLGVSAYLTGFPNVLVTKYQIDIHIKT